MQGECRHGGHGWRARGDLHDAGGEFDAFGLVRQIGEGGGGIAPPGFSGKGHVHTQALSDLHPLDRKAECARPRAPQFNGKFHISFPSIYGAGFSW